MNNPSVDHTPIYDVVIAGAGPAGSICATRLASAGLKTLVLEKDAHPREKLCAGGLPGCIFDIFPDNQAKSQAISITSYRFTFRGEKESAGNIEAGRIYSVSRSDFDASLAALARESGAEIIENERVVGAEEKGDNVKIRTSDGREFTGRFLVGADGGGSTVARIFGFFPKARKKDFGICGYFVFSPDRKTRDSFKNTIHLDFSFLEGGVAGILPKEDHLWLGAYKEGAGSLKELEKETLRFIQCLGMAGETGKFMGLALPLYRRRAAIAKGRVLLAGEAARLVNPLSGEGIKPAIESGIIAAEEIIKAMNGGSLAGYTTRIHEEIGKELILAGHFAKIAHAFPSFAYEGMTRVVQDALRIMNGDLSYGEFLKRLKSKVLKKAGIKI